LLQLFSPRIVRLFVVVAPGHPGFPPQKFASTSTPFSGSSSPSLMSHPASFPRVPCPRVSVPPRYLPWLTHLVPLAPPSFSTTIPRPLPPSGSVGVWGVSFLSFSPMFGRPSSPRVRRGGCPAFVCLPDSVLPAGPYFPFLSDAVTRN